MKAAKNLKKKIACKLNSLSRCKFFLNLLLFQLWKQPKLSILAKNRCQNQKKQEHAKERNKNGKKPFKQSLAQTNSKAVGATEASTNAIQTAAGNYKRAPCAYHARTVVKHKHSSRRPEDFLWHS